MSARNIHYLTGFLLIAVISVGLVLLASNPEVPNEEQVRSEFRMVYSSGVLDWQEILSKKRGLATPEDWTRIDFSPPGSPTFGDNPDNEFFNPAGKFKASPLSVEGRDLRPIFNVRRFMTSPDTNGAGVMLIQHTSLYAIVPIGADCGVADQTFTPAKDNREIVVDNFIPRDCYRSMSGGSLVLVRLAGNSKNVTEQKK